MKIFNDYNRNWHKRALKEIVESLKDGQEQYTHHFYHVVTNKMTDYEMRQALRTLEHDGLIECIKIMATIHKWKITENGKTTISTP